MAAPVARTREWLRSHPKATLAELVAQEARFRGVPESYAHALVDAESDWQPREQGGRHWGLFQVGTAVLEDYQARFGGEWNLADMLDPAANTAMAMWMLARIEAAYRQLRLVRGWGTVRDRWVITWGWNAGWSQSRGVARALALWGARRERPGVAIDQIPAVRLWRWVRGERRSDALMRVEPSQVVRDLRLLEPGQTRDLGLTRHLGDEHKLRWARAVAARSTQRQPQDPEAHRPALAGEGLPRQAPHAANGQSTGWLWIGALAAWLLTELGS